MELAMIRANVQEQPEQKMASFLLGLNNPIRKIAEFQPYSNMVELLHNAIKAERQVQEDNKYAKTKAYFASKNASNAQPSSSSRFQNAYKAPLKQDKENPKPRSAPTANSSMASTGSSKINCYKCGGKGHKSFECVN